MACVGLLVVPRWQLLFECLDRGVHIKAKNTVQVPMSGLKYWPTAFGQTSLTLNGMSKFNGFGSVSRHSIPISEQYFLSLIETRISAIYFPASL